MRQSIGKKDGLIWADGTRLTDLDFADDLVLIDKDVEKLQELITAVQQEASKVGLRINSDKCRVMVTGDWEGRSDINASGAAIETVENFCYLDCYISSTGNCDKEGYELAKHHVFFQSYSKYKRARKSIYR